MPSAIPTSSAPPILDFSAFESSDPEIRSKLIQEIRGACQTHGFFQLINHGISPTLQSSTLSAAKSFFSLPFAEKQKLDKTKNTWNRGYEAVGSQMLEAGTKPELKEGLYIGEEIPRDHPDCVSGVYNRGPNFWPDVEKVGDFETEEFKGVCMGYYWEVFGLAQRVFQALALGLGLDDDFFSEFTKDAIGTLRFIHYPPSDNSDSKERGIGAHRDFGALTILMQDEVGGLQVLNEPSGDWMDIEPIPNAYVVNLGNLMMRWTNHKYNSNLHRVINKSGKDRYSIPFFFTGNARYTLTCVPGCEDQEVVENGEVVEGKKASRYAPISVGDYVTEQFSSSYKRAEDHKGKSS